LRRLPALNRSIFFFHWWSTRIILTFNAYYYTFILFTVYKILLSWSLCVICMVSFVILISSSFDFRMIISKHHYFLHIIIISKVTCNLLVINNYTNYRIPIYHRFIHFRFRMLYPIDHRHF
jgi:hypothetical protein